MEVYDWHNIEFLKIDAEGEEANIIRGGTRFFATVSPLIQYEIKAGSELHLELVQAFTELGYSSYRLVPGLNLLTPFDEKEPADGFLLNLFCCKSDRADRLADRGFLVQTDAARRFREVQSNGVRGHIKGDQTNSWLTTLMKYPYGELCAEHWQKTVDAGNNREVEAALLLYSLSRNYSLTAVERFAALEDSFISLRNICETQPTYLRLSSLARVARDYGARSLAVNALGQLCDTLFNQRQVNPSEPFLAPGERFDSVSPRNDLGSWIAAAALEEFERNGAFSSFYTGRSTLQHLESIRDLGFGGAEMNRRLDLIQLRFGSSNIKQDHDNG